MNRYLSEMEKDDVFIGDQIVEVKLKSRKFVFNVGWPKVSTMQKLNRHFYSSLGFVTDEMEQTQFGINFLFAFIKGIKVMNIFTDEMEVEVPDMDSLSW